MRITQGTFSYLPDLSDEQIAAQLKYCVENGWAVSVEYTDDPHPRNSYWEMWSLPMFDVTDPSVAIAAMNECRKAFPNHYVKVNGFDSSKGRQTTDAEFYRESAKGRAGIQSGAHRRSGPPRAVRDSTQAQDVSE